MVSTPFEALPNELICMIGNEILGAKSLSSISRCSRHLAAVLTPLLHEIAIEDHDGLPAIHWAARQGHESLVEFLLDDRGVPIDLEQVPQDDTVHRTPLDYAVEARQASMVRLLLGRGAEVNISDANSNRRTPIYIAAQMGLGMKESRCKTPLCSILDDGVAAEGLTIAEILLDHGANPNCTRSSTSSETALHYAAAYGHTAMVKLLLEKGAEVDLRDQFGKTALHKVISESKEDEFAAQVRTIDMVEMLGWWGADVFAVDSGSKTVMAYALEKGMYGVLESLQEHWVNCYGSAHLCFGQDF